mmetsp:Transcript_10411/g.14342  ORF Transcript_10411/g.14342 Transcript_10411/m.14342 type:complete len:402 (-) Transcript_10411:66-1271(-)
MLLSKTVVDVEANDEGIKEKAKDASGWSRMFVLEGSSKQVFDAMDNSRSTKLATGASWLVNWFLLGAKIFVVAESSSKAVAASLADSAVDLVSQAVLALADSYMNKHSPYYPVGRSRLEALSVIACACIMSMASVEVIQYSVIDIFDGIAAGRLELDVGLWSYLILSIGTFLKILLFFYCNAVNKIAKSDTLAALAEDHLNDVFSNTAAIVTISIASQVSKAWWVDPVGAILISLVIIYRWVQIISEQVKKIVGHTAPQDFIDKVEVVAREHDVRLYVDCTRVYHFGSRFNVEMEIVLPGSMTVAESHDIALALQHKIESLPEIERAFVHVDHERRDGLEHKVERELVRSLASGSGEPASLGSSSPHKSTALASPSDMGIELRARPNNIVDVVNPVNSNLI